jgi:transformation/transcription domain-associated protein
LTLKIEQRERFKTNLGGDLAAVAERRGSDSPGSDNQAGVTQVGSTQQSGAGAIPESSGGAIRATAPMWRCSRIMHMQRDLHPTVLSSLEGIVDQMVWFRENMYEEVLRQLRQGLAKCYIIAFDSRANVAEATITPHTLNFVKKLVSTFGIGIENITSAAAAASMPGSNVGLAVAGGNVAASPAVGGAYSSAANESLMRRAQASQQDPVFQKMKSEFTSNFDFTQPGSMKLQNLILKLKKWIKILEVKTKALPKSFLVRHNNIHIFFCFVALFL